MQPRGCGLELVVTRLAALKRAEDRPQRDDGDEREDRAEDRDHEYVFVAL